MGPDSASSTARAVVQSRQRGSPAQPALGPRPSRQSAGQRTMVCQAVGLQHQRRVFAHKVGKLLRGRDRQLRCLGRKCRHLVRQERRYLGLHHRGAPPPATAPSPRVSGRRREYGRWACARCVAATRRRLITSFSPSSPTAARTLLAGIDAPAPTPSTSPSELGAEALRHARSPRRAHSARELPLAARARPTQHTPSAMVSVGPRAARCASASGRCT